MSLKILTKVIQRLEPRVSRAKPAAEAVTEEEMSQGHM